MGVEGADKAGAARKPVSDLEKLKLGESVWLRGCLVTSLDGLLTLEARGSQIIVNAGDVRSKENFEGETLVEVSPEANVLVRTEAVLRADTGRCDCPDSGAEPRGADGTAALKINDTFRDPFLPNVLCRWEWRQVFVCHWVVIRCRLRRFCYPELRQVVICWHEGTGGVIT